MELKVLVAQNAQDAPPVARDGKTSRHTVQVVSRDGTATPPRPFFLPVADRDHDDLRWYLEEYMDLPFGGAAARAEGVERRLEALGRAVFASVFDGGTERDLLGDLLRGESPRLLTVVTSDPAVMRLPWELVRRGDRLLFQEGVVIRRQVEGALPADGAPSDGTIRVLLVVSRPEGLGFIDPRCTTPAILDALDLLRREGRVALDFCRPPTMGRLESLLDEARRHKRPYHVVHFEGHGMYQPKLGLGALCFETADHDHKVDPVDAGRLGDVLARHGIRLVILEACRSGQVSEHTMFHSVAPRLLAEGVGSVVAMSHAVHVEATRILLQRFYEVLSEGGSVGAAVDSGRRALIAEPHRWLEPGTYGRKVKLQDWFLPVLYQRTPDDPVPFPRLAGQVFAREPVGAAEGRAPARGRASGAFPSSPRHRFRGRARELHRLERVLEDARGVLVHGMGGMGKTTLATEAAHWLCRAGRFPAGACFFSFEGGGGADDAMLTLGAYVDGETFRSLPPDQQEERAAAIMREQPILVVWDNFESVLPGHGNGVVGEEERSRILAMFRAWTEDERGEGRILVTCRERDAGLRGARPFSLEGLTPTDALEMAAWVLHDCGIDRNRADLWEEASQNPPSSAGKGKEDEHRDGRPQALEKLLEVLGRHPLSIELVVPHLEGMAPGAIVAEFRTLLDRFQADADEARNASLRASLAFSTEWLSEPARAAMQWLGWFTGGVFEQLLLGVSGLEAEQWEPARVELERLGLVEVDDEVRLNGRPYLRLHPTLPFAVDAPEAEDPERRMRLVAVYWNLMKAANEALKGAHAAGGMAVMRREESAFRRAVELAFEAGAVEAACDLGDTVRDYLERAGRLRERNAWVESLRRRAGGGELTVARADLESQAAEQLLQAGRPEEALAALQDLIERLKQPQRFDTAFQLAMSSQRLGRMYVAAGRSDEAIPVLEQALERWAALGDAHNRTACLGDLANALWSVGNYDAALQRAEEGLQISRGLGYRANVARGLGQVAQILTAMVRWSEAEARYEEALTEARAAGDQGFEATLLWHLGFLARKMGNLATASERCAEAVRLFQTMGDDEGVMKTFDLLGTVAASAGRLPEARQWYEKALDMARARSDLAMQASALQNLGINCQLEGEELHREGKIDAAMPRLREALRFVGESLEIQRSLHNPPGEAGSLGQMAKIHLLLGDLDAAETNAHKAREIGERLRLPDVWKNYATLERVATARGDAAEADRWRGRKEAVQAGLRARARGTDAQPDPIAAIAAIANAARLARAEGGGIPSKLEHILAQWEAKLPPPLDALAPFLRAVAGGAPLPALPENLPDPIPDLVAQVIAACRDIDAS